MLLFWSKEYFLHPPSGSEDNSFIFWTLWHLTLIKRAACKWHVSVGFAERRRPHVDTRGRIRAAGEAEEGGVDLAHIQMTHRRTLCLAEEAGRVPHPHKKHNGAHRHTHKAPHTLTKPVSCSFTQKTSSFCSCFQICSNLFIYICSKKMYNV